MICHNLYTNESVNLTVFRSITSKQIVHSKTNNKNHRYNTGK